MILPPATSHDQELRKPRLLRAEAVSIAPSRRVPPTCELD